MPPTCRRSRHRRRRRRNRRAGRGGGFAAPRPPKTVQINWNASEQLARTIAIEAAKVGSTRRFIARLMKQAGFDVPEADLNPADNRRRWT